MTMPDGVRLGVSPLSWINEVIEAYGRDTTAHTCLSEAAAAGYAGVETSRKFPNDSGKLKALLGKFNFVLASGWHSGELATRDVAAEMEAVADHARLLSAMGCDVMVYGEVAMMAPGSPLDVGMSHRITMPQDSIADYAARLTEFASRLHTTYGLRLAYHHHLMMIAETWIEIDAILTQCGPDVGLLLDTGHAYAGGFDYQRLIKAHGARIVHIHLKDVRDDVLQKVRTDDKSFNDGVRAGMFTVPGDGCVDFAPLVRFVRDSGYQGWLVVEAEQDPDTSAPGPAVTRAFNHISNLFGTTT